MGGMFRGEGLSNIFTVKLYCCMIISTKTLGACGHMACNRETFVAQLKTAKHLPIEA